MKYTKLTPNLIVRNVETSIHFYCSVLGFEQGMTVPEKPPYVFGSVVSGTVEIFFNEQNTVAQEFPELAGEKIGGTLTLFIEVEGIEEVLRTVEKSKCKITMPLKAQFYGMREFAFEDPEGWTLTIAERVK